jgi:hypothetical protein
MSNETDKNALPDRLKNALPPIQPWGGPPLESPKNENEYANAPYSLVSELGKANTD